MLDIRNTPVSIDDAEALAAYEGALKSFQIYVGDPVAQLNTLIEAHPDFIMAHLLRGICFYLSSERVHYPRALASLEAARGCLSQANEREQGFFAATETLMAGRWEAACREFDAVLRAYPHDVLALQTAHLMDFFRGDAKNLRDRPGRVLAEWDEGMPGYSYVMGMQAFGLEESNQYAQAEATGLRALEIDPIDAWAVHAVVHVLEMQGRAAEGIAFLGAREPHWAVDNGFSYHNWWHLALMHLDQGDDERVLEIFDTHIAGVDDTMVMLDNTAMLWRLHLIGIDVTERMQRAAQVWAQKLEADDKGFYAFNDFHAALAFAACGDDARLAELQAALAASAHGAQISNQLMSAEVGAPLVQGVREYAKGEYAKAASTLLEVRDGAHRFGGSHAQRDVIELTLLSAAHKAQDWNLTRHLRNERRLSKVDDVLGGRICA